MHAAACGAPCCRPLPPASPETTRPLPPRPTAHAVCIATTSMALTTSSSTTPTPAKSSSPSTERKNRSDNHEETTKRFHHDRVDHGDCNPGDFGGVCIAEICKLWRGREASRYARSTWFG